VIGAFVAWALVLLAARFVGGVARLATFVPVCSGFFLGMLWMYIATRVCK
jgi:hypothetical protein